MDLDLAGRVVIVTDASAGIGRATVELLAAAKAAPLSLPKALATEFGSRDVRSNVVSPDPTRTRLWDAPGGFADQLAQQFELEREAVIEHFVTEVRSLSLGRIGTPEDGARVIAFLLSPASAQVTGSEYAVDGGARREI